MKEIDGGPRGPRTVKLTWKLPARLRRPVRDELNRARVQAKKRQAIIRFEKRPISSDVPVSRPPYRPTTTPNSISAQQHTGDVYFQSRPKVQLPPPSYTGRVLAPRAPARQVAPPVPKPKTRPAFSSPLHVQILPQAAFPTPKKVQPLARSKPARGISKKNLLFLVLGSAFILVAGLSLQRAGRATAALATISEKAFGAYGKLTHAQQALAEQDFSTSQQDFSDANALLHDAQQQLDEALASSKFLIEAVDVTDTLRSGDALLSAGQDVSQAGDHIVAAIKPLVDAHVFADAADQKTSPTLVDALNETIVQLRQARTLLASASEELKRVNPSRLPASVAGQWETLTVALPKAQHGIDAFLNTTEPLMYVLGANQSRDYLLAFQNNDELRATGGFIGSLAVVHVDRGLVEKIDVKSVYDLDGQLTQVIAPPEPLRAITDRWYLRDSNFFIDWSQSARKMMSFLEKEKGPTVDGVITLTPEVIRNLLTITGPIDMPDYKATVTADNFVSLTQQEVTYFYDKSANKPKQFLADLTPLLLNKLFKDNKQNLGKSLSVLFQMLHEKQMLLYFRDEGIQSQLERAGLADTLPVNEPALLAVNNMNVGGHKSDQFIEQTIQYQIHVNDDGAQEAVVTIRRTHHGPTEKLDVPYPAGEDPALKDNIDYQRVLVPVGSQLVAAEGFSSAAEVPRLIDQAAAPEDLSADPDVTAWQQSQAAGPGGTMIGREAGYTFFANWQITRPGQTTVGIYRYTLPTKVAAPGFWRSTQQFPITVIKQPGEMRTTVSIEVQLPAAWRITHTAPTTGTTQLSDSSFAYRGALRYDLKTGALYENK